mmetsp:Transcript_15507/g.39242  ORF Transcript_15507/g.39242 Transcript_15507/m.39242 type:complete len:228 (-) Transcript_15507:184-867(-)
MTNCVKATEAQVDAAHKAHQVVNNADLVMVRPIRDVLSLLPLLHLRRELFVPKQIEPRSVPHNLNVRVLLVQQTLRPPRIDRQSLPHLRKHNDEKPDALLGLAANQVVDPRGPGVGRCRAEQWKVRGQPPVSEADLCAGVGDGPVDRGEILFTVVKKTHGRPCSRWREGLITVRSRVLGLVCSRRNASKPIPECERRGKRQHQLPVLRSTHNLSGKRSKPPHPDRKM